MVRVLSVVDHPECHCCGARAKWLLEGQSDDVDYPSPEAAYTAGWRVAAAYVGSRQGILVFHCPQLQCAQRRVVFNPHAILVQHGRRVECEPYEGPEQWWTGRRA